MADYFWGILTGILLVYALRALRSLWRRWTRSKKLMDLSTGR